VEDASLPSRQFEELLAIGQALGLTLATVKRDVAVGEAWLNRALQEHAERELSFADCSTNPGRRARVVRYNIGAH
jgi:hypothetical protein